MIVSRSRRFCAKQSSATPRSIARLHNVVGISDSDHPNGVRALKDAAALAGLPLFLAWGNGVMRWCGRNFLSGEPAYLVRWEDNIERRLTEEDFKS